MLSPETYNIISKPLIPIFKQLGFKKISSSQPKWFKVIDEQEVHFYLKTNKYAWDSFSGCNIRVEFYIFPKTARTNESNSIYSSAKYFYNLDTNQLETILQRNYVVAEKIRNIDLQKLLETEGGWYEDIEELQLLHQTSIMYLDQYYIKERVEMMMEVELLYLDKEDVEYWRDFLSSILEKNISRLVTKTL